jgi:predicted RNA-binding Zn-ribbon protein involved in translation (DUF1610 family)
LVIKLGERHLHCPYCGSEEELPDFDGSVEEQDFASALQAQEGAEPHIEADLCHCDSCGADVTPPPGADSFACPYCASDIVRTTIHQRLLKPQGVLPFALDRELARKRWHLWLGRLWFAPNNLSRMAVTTEAVKPVYVPFWTYDARTDTGYRGSRGITRTVTVGTGKNRRTTTRTSWYPTSGLVRVFFDDVLIPATQCLPLGLLKKLEPWSLPKLEPFREEMLAGVQAQRYQVDLTAGFSYAQQEMAPKIDQAIRRDIGGDKQRIHHKSTQYSRITFKHILLPVYVAAYRYNNKTYQLLVNAATGEVQGQRPWSVWKLTLVSLAGAQWRFLKDPSFSFVGWLFVRFCF